MLRSCIGMLATGAVLLTAGGFARAEDDIPDDGDVTAIPDTLPDSIPAPPPYHFSDEIGGFSILSVSGIGTRDDPVRIAQAIATASPVTMVIRAIAPINPFGIPGPYATGVIHIELDIANRSGVPWIGLELELQEHYTRPSVYGDGLSFDQRRMDRGGPFSSAFAGVRQNFEPYDRLLFENGALDDRARGMFRFIVTDMTPAAVFYIRFDPRIPAS